MSPLVTHLLPSRRTLRAGPRESACYYGTTFFYLLLPQLMVARAIFGDKGLDSSISSHNCMCNLSKVCKATFGCY
jgi:hypothetical protein